MRWYDGNEGRSRMIVKHARTSARSSRSEWSNFERVLWNRVKATLTLETTHVKISL